MHYEMGVRREVLKKRAISIVLALLITSTTTAGILSHMNEKVKVVDAARATGGSSQEDYQPIIDYDWVWHRTKDLSEIVNNSNIPDHDKGRSFGSGGEQNASKMIEQWMKDIGLENVNREKINQSLKLGELPWRIILHPVMWLGSLGNLTEVRHVDVHWICFKINDTSTGEVKEINLTYKENGRSSCFPFLAVPRTATKTEKDDNGTTYYIWSAKDLTLAKKMDRNLY